MEMVYILFPFSEVPRCVVAVYISTLGRYLIGFLFGGLFRWLRLIVENRPQYDDEDVDDLDNISDVRNGVFANSIIHAGLDSREAVILKVCPYIRLCREVLARPHFFLSDPQQIPWDQRYSHHCSRRPTRSSFMPSEGALYLAVANPGLEGRIENAKQQRRRFQEKNQDCEAI